MTTYQRGTLLIAGAVALTMLGPAGPAYADSYKKHWKQDHSHNQYHKKHYKKYHKKHSYSFGHAHYKTPRNSITISIGGLTFHYDDGVFYRRGRQGYYKVRPPVGACLSRLPFGYRTLYLKGGPYFVYKDVYYRQVPAGYVVVEEPVVVPSNNNAVRVIKEAEASHAEIIINIPNKNGGYTAVTLIPSEEGFVGPQGELYTEFPKVTQLQLIYGT